MQVADERGLRLTTSNAAAVEHYDTAIRRLLEYRVDAMDHLRHVLEADPECAMGHCLQGYICMLAGTVTTREQAQQSLERAAQRGPELSPRERAHVQALRLWYTGDLLRAEEAWEAILLEHPADVLALRLQHFALFWSGRSLALRDAIARVFDTWDERMPGYGSVLGMYAFGLEESGDYAAAEAHGKRAVELNPDDLWSIHAVAHVLDMQGRLREGNAWLAYAPDAWTDRSAMQTHLWWHAALYPLELGDYDRVLELYDTAIWPDQGDFYIEIQNAASLLCRLACRGVGVANEVEDAQDLHEARRQAGADPHTRGVPRDRRNRGDRARASGKGH